MYQSKLIKLVAAVCGISLYTCFTYSVSAATVDSNLTTGWDAITQSEIKSDVYYLASDNMQGRMSLSHADMDATHWIEEQFKNTGLQPANGESYLQAVPLIQYTPDRNKSYLKLEVADKKIKWLKPDVFTDFYKDITVSGPVVFAGYGITAPALRYDDYQDIDVHSKIVLVFEHEPQELNDASIFNGKANTIYATNRIKALNAQNHGAIAVLVAPEPNRKHPSNHDRQMRIGGSVTRAIPVPSQVRQDDELQIPVVVISDKVANAIAGKQLSLSKRQSEIDNDLKPRSQLIEHANLVIHDQSTTHTKGIAYNVVGLLPGNDPMLKNETIIISAHHDHNGISKGKIWHGADDNASGTAGVVTLAKALSTNAKTQNGLAPKRSILFVVFAAEERGLLGAFYMAQHPLRPLASTRAMINFDMIGRNEQASTQTKGLIKIPSNTTNRLNLIGGHYSPDYVNIIKQLNGLVGLDLDDRFDNEAALNVFFRSDQFPFVLQHIPAFWWFTGFHPDYHQTSDTADKINYRKMQKILRLAYLSAYTFANAETVPGFIENPG